jgi:hypothetical protein
MNITSTVYLYRQQQISEASEYQFLSFIKLLNVIGNQFNMLKGLRSIVIGSAILSIVITGVLTSFKFDKLVYVNAPYPPNPPTFLSIDAWLFCICLTILLAVLFLLFVMGHKMILRNRS